MKMRQPRFFFTMPTVLLVAACGAMLEADQETPAEAAFTREQVTAGKGAFAKACASCHMPDLSGNNEVPALAGASFTSTWGARTTKELFDYMSGAMPPGGPALSVQSYESILAYVLHNNGASAGSNPLTASTRVPIGRLVKATQR
jgi:mono/diheme cytochrome c family protein